MKAKKSYGQHFLTSETISIKIAQSLILPGDCSQVLEIGPGRGMLTKHLDKQDYELHLVEADRDMVSYISKNFPHLADRLISSDVLKVNFASVFSGQFAVIGNFPYNISTQIIFKVIEYKEQIPQMVGMFQKEVAERICSSHGSRVYGIISVLAQAYYDTELLFDVSNDNFDPPPKVQSAVIRLTRKKEKIMTCDYKLFRRVVKTAFSQRRKMLRNTMKMIVPKSDLLLKDDMQKRPEHLSVQDFIDLTHEIDSYLQSKND